MSLALELRSETRAFPWGALLDRWLGYACGAAALVVSGLIYRTYGIAMPSSVEEMTRQLGAPYVLVEIAIFLWARDCGGYDPVQLFKRLPGPARGAALLFLSSFWISSVFVSALPWFSTALSLSWIIHLLFGGAVYHLAAGRRAEPARLAEGFAAGLTVLACLTAYHFLTPPNGVVVKYGPDGWGSAVPGFISHRLFGSWCATIAALLAGILWRRTSGTHRPAWLLPALFLSVMLMIWTGARAAVVGGVVALGAAVVADRRPCNRAFWPITMLIVATATPIAIALNPYGDPSFLLYRPPSTMTTIDGISSQRLTFWSSSLDVFRHYPLLGAGAGSTWWLVPLDGRYHVQPHNVIIQFLLNWGLIPSLPALALIGWATLAAHRAVRRDRARLPFLMALDCLLAMSFLDGMFHFAQFLMLIAVFYALCLAPGTGHTVDA